MLITISAKAPHSTTASLLESSLRRGFQAQAMSDGRGGTVIGVAGTLPADETDLPGIINVQTIHKPFMLASLEARERSIVRVGDVHIGGGDQVFMAGPCSIESQADLIEIAHAVKRSGGNILRGGAFKPRSSPYSFQGLGEEGLRALAAARDATGLPVVTEVMEPEQVELVAGYVDMLQIGSRNMANFPLLKRVGRSNIPVLLKRGFAATQEEFLMSAEYIMAGGNTNVVLCERGIRAFDHAFRFSLDLNVVPSIKELSHLPIVVDPSHGTGRRSLVSRMAMAGLAAGADGLMLEVHPDPDNALSDGYQTITPADLNHITRRAAMLADALAGFDSPDEIIEMPAAEICEADLEAIA